MSLQSTNAGQRPERMSLTNLGSGESLEMQYNPTDVSEDLQAVYQHLTILGQGHEEQQYLNTKNHLVEFDLNFDALTGNGYDIGYARRFLMSLFYARRDANDIRGGAPPRVLFVWPNFMALQAQIPKLKIKHSRFARTGQSTLYVASIGIEEIRDARLLSEDVLLFGTQRPQTGPQPV